MNRSPRHRVPWSAEEDQHLRDLILIEDDRTRIARTLGRSREAIDRRAFVLGLTLPKGSVRQPAN